MKLPSVKVQMITLAVLATGTLITWWPREEPPAPALRAAPEIAELTGAELAKLPDAALLQRLQLEFTRRILIAGDWRAGPETLSPPAFHLWAIEAQEFSLYHYGFAATVRIERDPRQTPLGPSLAQVAEAYASLGLEQIAAVVREAESIPFDLGKDGEDESFTGLDTRFRQAVGTGTQAKRLAYARTHRAHLLDQPEASR